MFLALSFSAIAALGAVLWLDVTPASAQSANLVANPALARGLPPPGWLAMHRDEWLREHPVYRATCESADVTKEIRFLNRLVAYDEYLLSLPNTPDPDNPASAQLAVVARQSTTNLRRDIVVADTLVAQLQLLPGCETAKPAPPVAATAISVRPEQASDKPAPPASEPKSAGTPQPAEAGNAPLPGSDRLVIRFDDRVAALTPSGIRAFNKAIAAARAGKPVKLTIEGCETGADFSRGSSCTRRRYSLENRLQEAGVKNPRRLFSIAPE